MITVGQGVTDITLYVVQYYTIETWWDVSMYEGPPFMSWREHDNRIGSFGLDDTLAFDNKNDAFECMRDWIKRNKKEKFRVVSRRFIITDVVVVEDEVTDKIKERLRSYYTEDEISQWLSAPHPLLGGETANDLIARGETDKVHHVINILDTDGYI